jgi:hypothetical protein
MGGVGLGGGSVLAEHGLAKVGIAAWGQVGVSLRHQQERLHGALAAWQATDARDEARTAPDAAESSGAPSPIRIETPRAEAAAPTRPESKATSRRPRLGRRMAEWLLPGLRRAREHRHRRIQRATA